MKYILAFFFTLQFAAFASDNFLIEEKSKELALQNSTVVVDIATIPLEEYWKGHGYFNTTFLKTSVREPETTVNQLVRWGCSLVLAAAVANGMIPVFLEFVEKNTDQSYNLTLAMIATGVVYGTDCLFSCLEKKSDETTFQWKMIAALSSVMPAYYLFEVEKNHHESEKNTSWDKYYTFFAALSVPLMIEKYLYLLNLGNSYHRKMSESSRLGIISKTLDALKDIEIKNVFRHVKEYNETQISLPALPLLIFREEYRFKVISGILPVVCIFSTPAIFTFFQMWKEIVPTAISSQYFECATGFLTVGSFGSAFVLNFFHFLNFDWIDIFFSPFGAAKSIPFMVLTEKATRGFDSGFQYTLISFASVCFVLEESKKSQKTFKNILKKIPYFQNMDWYRREFLKENLV